jgi:hypothetical protein
VSADSSGGNRPGARESAPSINRILGFFGFLDMVRRGNLIDAPHGTVLGHCSRDAAGEHRRQGPLLDEAPAVSNILAKTISPNVNFPPYLDVEYGSSRCNSTSISGNRGPCPYYLLRLMLRRKIGAIPSRTVRSELTDWIKYCKLELNFNWHGLCLTARTMGLARL